MTMTSIELLRYYDRLDALDAAKDKAHEKAEEIADETCDMFGLEGEERRVYWNQVYFEEYARMMAENEKNL